MQASCPLVSVDSVSWSIGYAKADRCPPSRKPLSRHRIRVGDMGKDRGSRKSVGSGVNHRSVREQRATPGAFTGGDGAAVGFPPHALRSISRRRSPTSFVDRFLLTKMFADSFASPAERDNIFIAPKLGILGFKLIQPGFQVPYLAFEPSLCLRAAAVLASAHCFLHTPPCSVDGEIPLCS